MKRAIAHELVFYKRWGNYRWRIKAKNGKIIASASEGYKNKTDCEYNARSTAASIRKHFR